MTSKKLRDVKISETFADANSILNAMTDLENRLSSLTIIESEDDLSDIIQILQIIMSKFGGKGTNTITLVFDQALIDEGRAMFTIDGHIVGEKL